MKTEQLAFTPIKSQTSKKFLYSRLHSLAGIVPLGLFLIEHFFSNATAILGERNYNETIGMIQSIPFLILFEIVFIAIPLLYHAIYGIYLSMLSKNNASSYSFKRNWMFVAQRMTGIITLIFIVYHVWSFRLSTAITGTEVSFQLVSEHLQNPFIFAFYVVGILSTNYHFCNGLSTGLITWGITIGAKSQKAATKMCLALFTFLSIIGLITLIVFI
ncbi:succinate dehydrogenase [bacterium LRH843]|nr:succinate dehydrogenase [bacterium LRH843]